MKVITCTSVAVALIVGFGDRGQAIASPWSYWDYLAPGILEPAPCRVPDTVTSVRVYFDRGDLPMDQVAAYKASLLRAIAVWNEESRGQRVLRFIDTAAPKNPLIDQVVVTHLNDPNLVPIASSDTFCHLNPNAHAYTRQPGASGAFCDNGRIIYVLLGRCDGLGSRNYKPGWVVNTSTMLGVGDLSYEAVLIHELGHACFGFPDIPDRTGVMYAYILPGEASSHLHLYYIDQNSAISSPGATTNHEFTRTLTDTAAWFGMENEYLPTGTASFPLSFGPGLAARLPTDTVDTVQVATAGRNAFTFRHGSPGAWNPTGSIVPPSYPAGYAGPAPPPPALWVRVAVSAYGEVVAAWPECNDLDHCRVVTAWRTGSSGIWSSGLQSIERPVFGPVEVEYDRWLDKFVIVGIGLDGKLWSSHANAWTPSVWTTPYTSMQDPNDARHYRFMGGMYFTLPDMGFWPPPSQVDVHGLLTVAAQDGTRPGQIFEYLIRWNNSLYNYDVDSYPAEVDGATLRHFEVARRFNSNEATSIWVNASNDQQLRTVQRTTSIFGYYGASSSLVWNSTVPIRSSVSIAARAQGPYYFVVGLSGVSP